MKRATKEEKAQAMLDLLVLSGIHWVNSLEASRDWTSNGKDREPKAIHGSVDVVYKSLLTHPIFQPRL